MIMFMYIITDREGDLHYVMAASEAEAYRIVRENCGNDD